MTALARNVLVASLFFATISLGQTRPSFSSAREEMQRVALFKAVECDDMMEVQRLLKDGARPGAKSSILSAAAAKGNYAMFALLRKTFPDLPLSNPDGSNVLHWLTLSHPVNRENLIKIANDALDAGADAHAVATKRFEKRLDQPLPLAVRFGMDELALLLLNRVKFSPAELAEAIPQAVYPTNEVSTLKKLIEKGGSVQEAAKNDPLTPLHRAVGMYLASAPIVMTLLDAGHPVDAVSVDRNRTPLLTAVASSRVEIVKILLDHGADPKRKDADGNDAMALVRIRAQKGRETGVGKYFNDVDDAAGEADRILAVLTKQ